MKQLTLLLLAVLVLKGFAAEAPPNKSGTSGSKITSEQANKARLDALDVLIKRNQYEQAFKLADRLVELYEGEPKFDFQYGMSAVETGHYDEALFAFERLVFTFPKEPRYRLELARTHFYLRNLIRAEIEFNKVLAQRPPKSVQNNVQSFLDKITELQRQVEPKFLFAIDMAGGYDSNINSATDKESLRLVVDGLPFEVPLDESAQETASSYWSTLLNVAYVSPISKTSSYDIRMLYNKRANTETPLFDLDTAMLEAGYGFYTGPVKWRASGRYQFVQLNGENFLNTVAGSASAFWLFNSGFMTGLSGNFAQTSYDANEDGDMTQSLINLSFISAPKRESWAFNLLFGTDSADEKSNEQNGKSYQGFTYQSTTLWGQRGSRYWMFNLISSEYDAESTTFAETRKDLSGTYGFGWRYAFTSSFSVRNDYALTYQDSNIEANTYDRAKVEFGLTYSF